MVKRKLGRWVVLFIGHLGLLIVPNIVQAEPNKNIIYDTVRFVQPKQSVLDHRKAIALANFGYKIESELGLDWRKALSIIYQESSFQTDPQDCLRIKRICLVDIGIGQINWKLWNRVFPIERLRLASDYEYALEVSFKIFQHYHKRYAKRSKYWYLYYHSGTPSKRITYRKHLKRHYDKMVVYTRGYADGRYEQKGVRRINFNKDPFKKEKLHNSNFEKLIRSLERRCETVRTPFRPICNSN